MKTCATCGTHVRGDACPHCGTTRATLRVTAPVLALLGLTLAGCGGTDDTGKSGDDTDEMTDSGVLYGVPSSDEDGDGYAADVDCDDANPDVHPDAAETAGDGVDSNCDGSDDT